MSNTIDSGIISQYQFANTATGGSAKMDELGADEFMTLLLEQLKNQDPLEPQDNGDFIAQMAQFSTVTGIDEMNTSISELGSALGSNQALQSANLVGRSVLVSANEFTLDEENNLEGAFELDSTSSATASVYTASGELVHQIDLGIRSPGQNKFSWDGIMENGDRAPVGDYTVAVDYGTGEYATAAEVMLVQKIDSVNFSNGGGDIVLNTVDGQSLNFSEITQIH